MPHLERSGRAVAALFVLTWLVGCAAARVDDAEALQIQVVSSPAAWVSGGDARIEVTVPAGVRPADVRIDRDGVPVTDRFRVVGAGRVLEGVLAGLPVGPSTIRVRAGRREAVLRLVNHDAAGPMFSGPPQAPFFCATEAHRARVGLGPILDADCSMETVVSFLYRSTKTGGFEPYDPAGPRPADLAQTTTLAGKTVDFIVRWERGTLNRFIYSIAVLAPAAQQTGVPDLSAWNGRVIYSFQGGVGVGHYQGDPSLSGMLYSYGLEKGYAVLYSTGTRTAVHYDLEVGGETALMVKDRFVSAYGKPLYTVGVGGSGGGIQQYVYGQNHPGLIDAAIPQYSYPDMVTQTIHVGDCELLERYMDAEVARDPNAPWATWTNRTWVQGLAASDTLPNEYRDGRPGLTECINGWRGLSPLTLNPHYGNAPGISPEAQAATVWTHAEDLRQIYGVAEDGFAARAWDNVGVQYGLEALRAGRISPAMFLDLNARVGSWKNEPEMVQEGAPFIREAGEVDPHSARNMRLSPEDRGDPPAPRAAADPGAIEGLYRHGMVFTGGLDIPVIDWRHYLEPFLDMHNTHQSFSARQRMLDHDGEAANHVIWFTGARSMKDRFDQTPMAFEVIDAWMTNLRNHPERGVAANKPARAVDSCFDADGERIYAGGDAWAGILDDGPAGPCTRRFRLYGTSRTVAGGPITGDVFKCALQPVDAAVRRGIYGDWVPSPAETDRLKAIFPDGVCDYAATAPRRHASH